MRRVQLLNIAIFIAHLSIFHCLDTYSYSFSTNSLRQKNQQTKTFSFAATPTYPLGMLEANRSIKVVIDIPYQNYSMYQTVNSLKINIRKGQNVLVKVQEFDKDSCRDDPQKTDTHCQFTFLIPQTNNYYLTIKDKRQGGPSPPFPPPPPPPPPPPSSPSTVPTSPPTAPPTSPPTAPPTAPPTSPPTAAPTSPPIVPPITIPLPPTAPGPPPPINCQPPRGPPGPPHRGRVQWFTVIVTYFDPAQPLSVGNANSIITLLKITQMRRIEVKRLVYVSTRSNYTATLYPVMSGDRPRDKSISLFAIQKERNQNNNWRPVNCIGNLLFGPCIQQVDDQNKLLTYDTSKALYPFDASIEPGYYILVVRFDARKFPQSVVRFTFQTDQYACPYPRDHPDYYNNFQGCLLDKSPTDQLPCINFDYVQQRCVDCLSGYKIANTSTAVGICLADRSCPDRQFFHFGKCYPVSQLCGEYDPFTGICLTCGQPDKYDVIDGECIEKELECGQRQWEDTDNGLCIDVSDTCGDFDKMTGRCETCISQLYSLNTEDGTCVEINSNCPNGFYWNGFLCQPLPFLCTEFNVTLKRCTKCLSPYIPDENGTCIRRPCPDRQYPSGIEEGACLDVSPLCDDYNPLNGFCISCKQIVGTGGYVPIRGVCKQIKFPLAGCQASVELGFGRCPPNQQLCLLYNVERRICVDCEDGYYPNYQGLCVPNAVCGPGHFSLNGHCFRYPPNCIEVDQLGRCSRCVNETFSLVGYRCFIESRCQPNQFRNQLGNCIAVANCRLANPSSNYCINCMDGRPSNFGVCCSVDEVFFNGICVPTLQGRRIIQIIGAQCLYADPAGYCKRCNPGFVPDFSRRNACRPIRS